MISTPKSLVAMPAIHINVSLFRNGLVVVVLHLFGVHFRQIKEEKLVEVGRHFVSIIWWLCDVESQRIHCMKMDSVRRILSAWQVTKARAESGILFYLFGRVWHMEVESIDGS